MPQDLKDLVRLPAILCALREEFAPLASFVQKRRTVAGFEVLELEIEGRRALAGISGVGKVWAARAATVLASEGASCLLIPGVCGGLSRGWTAGSVVHGTEAVQWDAWNKRGRSSTSDERLRRGWQQVFPGAEGRILTGDRAVFHPLRARALKKAYPGPAACDMETAAAAAIAGETRLPWAVARAVTDQPRWIRRGADFQRNFPEQAGRAAASVPSLLEVLRGPSE